MNEKVTPVILLTRFVGEVNLSFRGSWPCLLPVPIFEILLMLKSLVMLNVFFCCNSNVID